MMGGGGGERESDRREERGRWVDEIKKWLVRATPAGTSKLRRPNLIYRSTSKK
jgi:hypothetical protein